MFLVYAYKYKTYTFPLYVFTQGQQVTTQGPDSFQAAKVLHPQVTSTWCFVPKKGKEKKKRKRGQMRGRLHFGRDYTYNRIIRKDFISDFR